MENNNWNNRNRGNDYHYGDRNIDRNRRTDEDSYRGAYRMDTESDHHNVSTYNGFGDYNRSRDNRNEEQNHGGDYVYRRSRDREDNDRNYQSYNRGGNQQQYSRDNDRDQGQYARNYSGRNHRTTFNDDYAPDNYRHRDGENYGNMAGSLSFGYDGDRNSDPDYNRRYDPLSGRMRDNRNQHSGDRNSENQQRRYGPPDEYGFNPDYDRY